MIYVALLLGAIGFADLFRSQQSPVSRDENIRAAIAGSAVFWIGATGLKIPWAIPIVGTALVFGWVAATSARAKVGRRPWPVVGLLIAVAATLGLTGVQEEPTSGWLVNWYYGLGIPALADWSLSRFMLVAGSGLLLMSSANLIVRMILESVDTTLQKAESNVPGGRLIGPIERLIIFALALAGEYLALSAIVAAKSILRYPEISGPESKKDAEYVLIGSLISWGLALVLVPLTQGL